MAVYAIDMDGVIAHTRGNNYPRSRPNREAIGRVNLLYDAGNVIKIFTARGSSSGKDWWGLTKQQLSDWEVKYHQLIMGKPSYDVIIDDKALCASAFLNGGCPLQANISRRHR